MKYALDIEWDPGADLPSLVGPFESEAEAIAWADLNVVNGAPTVRTLAPPYASKRQTGGAK